MSPTSPTPFVVLPNEEGEMTDTAKGAAQDCAEADRRRDARRRVDGHPARRRRPRFLRDAAGSGPP